MCKCKNTNCTTLTVGFSWVGIRAFVLKVFPLSREAAFNNFLRICVIMLKQNTKYKIQV